MDKAEFLQIDLQCKDARGRSGFEIFPKQFQKELEEEEVDLAIPKTPNPFTLASLITVIKRTRYIGKISTNHALIRR